MALSQTGMTWRKSGTRHSTMNCVWHLSASCAIDRSPTESEGKSREDDADHV